MNYKIKKNISFLSGIFLPFVASFLIFSNVSAQVSFGNPIKATDLRQLVKDILDVVVEFGAVIVVFFLVYAGFLFVKAQGNDGELTKAKSTFFWTIVGGMVVLGAHVLSRVIQDTVNQIQG